MIDWSVLAPDELLARLAAGVDAGDGASGFLDTHQYAQLAPESGIQLNGGHDCAQLRRCSLRASPEVEIWMASRDLLPSECRNARALRRLLLSSGLNPSSIGDVIMGSSEAWIATLPGLEPPSALSVLKRQDGAAPPEAPLEKVTCAALRADAVIAALFRVSRGEAQTALEYDFVFRNFRPLRQRTTAVATGDELVYRSKGRIHLEAVEDSSKSGRLWLSYRSYPA